MPRGWDLISQLEGFNLFRHGPNLKIVLSRPKKGNALTFEMLQGIRELVEKAGKDRTVFRIVVTGQGKFFCTGMDLKASTSHSDSHDRQWHGIVSLLDAIERSPKVTVAVINGPAYGAGLGLAFACDIRLATKTATFTVSEAKLGIPPTVILKQLMREWGMPRAREATLSARPVTAEELQSAGLINELAADSEQLERLSDHLLDQLTACGPEASRLSKAIFLAPASDHEQLLKATYDVAMAPSEETAHGLDCFHSKTAPDWEDFYKKIDCKL